MTKAAVNLHAAHLFDDAVAMEHEFFLFMMAHQDDNAIDQFLDNQWAKFPAPSREGAPWGKA